MKKNITILCNSQNFKKRVAKNLADQLDMLYADLEQILEYNMINDDMLEKAGQQYFDENEKSTLKNVANYENTVITLDFSTLNKENNAEILRQSTLVIYLSLEHNIFDSLNVSENDKNLASINEIVYADRDKLLRSFADITVDVSKVDINLVTQQIMLSIQQYFEK